MSSRTQHGVKSTVDKVSIFSIRGNVSGSTAGGDMSGSVIVSTDPRATVTFASSSLGLPSGSIRLTLPIDNRYSQCLHWQVEVYGSGNVTSSFAGTTGGALLGQPQNYGIFKYGNNTSNGTFDFGFVQAQMTASSVAGVGPIFSGHVVGAVPKDESHSTAVACEWSLVAYLRNTNR